MSVEQTLELYNLLNRLKSEPGSHREYAVAKTLRKLKPFVQWYNEQIEAIDIDCCLTEEKNGQHILVKQILKVTNGTKTEEVAVPTYSKEGEEKRAKMKKELLSQFYGLKEGVDIHQTRDAGGLTPYEKVALEELGFLAVGEEQEQRLI